MAELQDEAAQMSGYRNRIMPFRCPNCREKFDTLLEMRAHYQMTCVGRQA